MQKIILILLFIHTSLYAGFMDSVGDLVESTLSDDKLEVEPEVTTVGTLSVANGRPEKKDDSMLSKIEGMVVDVKDSVDDVMGDKKVSSKDNSVLDDVVSGMKKTIGIKEEKKKKKSSLLEDTVTTMKEVAGLKKVKQDNSLFDGGIMGDMADMIDLEKGEDWGLPSVFGLNKRKQKKVFGSTVLGDTILGDVKETSTSFYRGFKTTGESTEFMSGMMYKSSKVYNEMFDVFDDSPLNVFDDKDEREPSIFDVFDKGNDMLDVFD